MSTYASYIDDVLADNIAPTKTVPEPNTIFGAVLALGAFAVPAPFQESSIKNNR
ncbi:hypothetical protein M595_3249 [Lyngbya aestuarii BL J]|uniref:Uncharacterized protein n=1 Tax=Lyngbya aestuarii BL J TaxID=1348334 RepID=U7QI88_9CYAN|nr:hypothetical protein [Lyngbya aestuarii]ERT06800.1 hypothetical protein M595_3249 [Lyngbya aestuarii BL J]